MASSCERYISYACPPFVAGARQLGGCVVCARSFSAEDLYDLDLCAKPTCSQGARASTGPAPDPEA